MRYRILPRALRPEGVRTWRGVILAGALGLLVLGTWAVLVYGEARRQAQRKAGRGASVVAQSVAREHERLVDAGDQLLLALSQRPEIVTVNPGACQALLAGIVKAVPGYLDLVAARPNGEVVCAARGALRLPAGTDATEVRRTAESGSPTLGRYALDLAARRPTVALARPVIDDTGRVRAVIVGALDLGQLERAVVESPLPAGAATMLVDASGVILSHYPQPERWAGELLDDGLKPLLASHGSELVDTVWLDGVPSLVLLGPLSRDAAHAADATIVITLPRRSVFREADHLFALELAGLGVLALAGLVCGALLMDRLVSRPAQGLLRVIRSLSSGDVRARMRRTDERGGLVGRLARSVNALGRRMEEHRQTARHLEEQLRTERAARLLAATPPAAPPPIEAPADGAEAVDETAAAAADEAPVTADGPAAVAAGRPPTCPRSRAGDWGSRRSRTRPTPASCGCRPPTPTRWYGSPMRSASGGAAPCSPGSRAAARR